jgi:RNA polymerase sigma-70 factor, ECF subfamily
LHSLATEEFAVDARTGKKSAALEKSTRILLPQFSSVHPGASSMRLNLQPVAEFNAGLAAKLLAGRSRKSRIKGVRKSPSFSHSGCDISIGSSSFLHWESEMVIPYTCGQQIFLDSPGASERCRPKCAELPESDAIRLAQRGDAGAFERIYQLHCRRVYALCLRMAGNPTEAEDLTQEAFLTVLRKIRTFRGESAFSTWLHRITVNLVLMRFRRKTPLESSPEKRIEPESDRGGPHEKFGGLDCQLAGSIDRMNLERAIERLSPPHKLVVELHDIQGYRHKEIAQIMDWSIGNSKAQLHRARRRLRELLQESFYLGWGAPCGQNR